MKGSFKAQWEEFRKQVIELDEGRCVVCHRVQGDVVLQVHHKKYLTGKKPWEYSFDMVETLCKGCHAREHGIIMPNSGWFYEGEDDLGSKCGSCELCGTSLRYVYSVFHPIWGMLEVGTVCCDNLTGTPEATEYKKLLERRNRFIKSVRWKDIDDGVAIKQSKMFISIKNESNSNRVWQIFLGHKGGKERFDSILDAKIHIFGILQDGTLEQFFEKYKISLAD